MRIVFRSTGKACYHEVSFVRSEDIATDFPRSRITVNDLRASPAPMVSFSEESGPNRI